MPTDPWGRSLDSWLSPEAGKGPPQDDAWRHRSGFLRDFDLSNTIKPEPTAKPRPVGQEHKPATPMSGGIDTRAYAEEHQRFRDMIRVFYERLMYAFPDIQTLDADQITLAAGWITDMEALSLKARQRAEGYLRHGLGEYLAEIDSSLKGLAQLKQVYAKQRLRIEREQRDRIAEINRKAEAHALQQQEERRRIWQETQEDIDALRRDTDRRRREAADRRHEEFLRYIRGEHVIGRIEIIES